MSDLAWTVNEVVKNTRIGRNRVFSAIRDGELKVIRIGRRFVVPVAEVEAWLAGLTDKAAAR